MGYAWLMYGDFTDNLISERCFIAHFALLQVRLPLSGNASRGLAQSMTYLCTFVPFCYQSQTIFASFAASFKGLPWHCSSAGRASYWPKVCMTGRHDGSQHLNSFAAHGVSLQFCKLVGDSSSLPTNRLDYCAAELKPQHAMDGQESL